MKIYWCFYYRWFFYYRVHFLFFQRLRKFHPYTAGKEDFLNIHWYMLWNILYLIIYNYQITNTSHVFFIVNSAGYFYVLSRQKHIVDLMKSPEKYWSHSAVYTPKSFQELKLSNSYDSNISSNSVVCEYNLWLTCKGISTVN